MSHPADAIPTDVCTMQSGTECPDPHCLERPLDWASMKCKPYSPPAAVCGQGEQACAPQCCQELSIGTLAEPAKTVNTGCCRNGVPTTSAMNEAIVQALAAEIVAGVEAARGIEPGPDLSVTTPEPAEEPTGVDRATAFAREALERGDGLMIVPAGTDEERIKAANDVLLGKIGLNRHDNQPMESILQEAERIVNGPRRASYGHPAVNFARIAHLWNGYLAALREGSEEQTVFGVLLTPQDVCQMMIQLKQCRIIQTPSDRDGHVDIAGYAQCSKLIAEKDEADAKAWALNLAEDVD